MNTFKLSVSLFFSLLYVTALTAQPARLTSYLISPKLDTALWEKDVEALDANPPPAANRCQTCTFQQTDSTRGRLCFNTSKGHVQLDTTLHHVSPEKLTGTWRVINYGIFEIADSSDFSGPLFYRKETILKEQQDAEGTIIFTDKSITTSFKNIEEIPNVSKKYKIIDGKYLVTKVPGGYCGPTITAITKEGLLILDDHTYKTLAFKGKYLVVRTSIRRIILKKEDF
ncbi:hypothetical protein [Foetidibacter luteolus]|uniref:hypothetical protein n=1 Tax=Foetidibacter luteolus TaxID=2608880 RepID=UPI00129BE823|nr:hypothetical protein [Foetidibacter luteolus]